MGLLEVQFKSGARGYGYEGKSLTSFMQRALGNEATVQTCGDGKRRIVSTELNSNDFKTKFPDFSIREINI